MDQLSADTRLAEHLVAAGACSREVGDDFTRRASTAWVPLGRLLVNLKKIGLREVGEVLSAQADDPKALFGDVAVRLGFCTEEDIAEALATQRTDSPHVLDLALDDPRVDRDKLLIALQTYIRHIERLVDRMDTALLERGPAERGAH